MKSRIFHGLLAVAVCGFLSMPAWSQGQGASHGQGQASVHAHSGVNSHAAGRSNKGGAVRGLARAQEVQSMNTKADTERGFTQAPGLTDASANASTQAGDSGSSPSDKNKSHGTSGKDQNKEK